MQNPRHLPQDSHFLRLQAASRTCHCLRNNVHSHHCCFLSTLFLENPWAAQNLSPQLLRYPLKKCNLYHRKGTMRCYGPCSTSLLRRRECTRSSGVVQTQRQANLGLSLGLQNMMLLMIWGMHGRSSKQRRKKGRKRRRNVSCYGLDGLVVFYIDRYTVKKWDSAAPKKSHASKVPSTLSTTTTLKQRADLPLLHAHQ